MAEEPYHHMNEREIVLDNRSILIISKSMSATTKTSSGITSAAGILSLTGSAVEVDKQPLRAPLTRDEAVGFQIDSPETWTDFHKRVHKLKPQGDYDVDIQILACGVCGSDVHTLCGGWGDQHYPLLVGHGM